MNRGDQSGGNFGTFSNPDVPHPHQNFATSGGPRTPTGGGGGGQLGDMQRPGNPGRTPATELVVAARHVKVRPNNLVTLKAGAWTEIGNKDRPHFLVPTISTDYDPNLGELQGFLFSSPDRPPIGATFNDQVTRATWSRNGMAYLPFWPGGKFYVAYWIHGQVGLAQDAGQLNCMLVDAEDPGVVADFMARPGENFRIYTRQSILSTTAVTVRAAQPWRKWLTVQNTGSNTVRVMQNPELIGVASMSGGLKGHQLRSGGEYHVEGDTLSKWRVDVCLDSGVAGGNTSIVEVVEGF